MDREHDGLEAQALLEHLLHVLAVVLVLLDALAVGVDVGVAGDVDDGAVLRQVASEARVEAGEDDVFQQDVAEVVVVLRDADDARQRGRDLDDAEQVALVLVQRRQRAGDVEGAVAQVWEGVARIDDQRREDGRDAAVEVAAHRVAVRADQAGGVDALDAPRAQEPLELVEGGRRLGDEARQLGEDGGDLLGGRHAALVVFRLVLEGGEARQAAHADHEELVQVALEDRDELQALEERHGLVEGF